MANRADEATAAVFKALADPTRRRILEQLREGELAAGEITALFPISGPSISRHLAVLKAAGLLSERRQANHIFYALVPGTLATALGGYLAAVCPAEPAKRERRKKKAKAPDKSPKQKNKPAASPSPATAPA